MEPRGELTTTATSLNGLSSNYILSTCPHSHRSVLSLFPRKRPLQKARDSAKCREQQTVDAQTQLIGLQCNLHIDKSRTFWKRREFHEPKDHESAETVTFMWQESCTMNTQQWLPKRDLKISLPTDMLTLVGEMSQGPTYMKCYRKLKVIRKSEPVFSGDEPPVRLLNSSSPFPLPPFKK